MHSIRTALIVLLDNINPIQENRTASIARVANINQKRLNSTAFRKFTSIVPQFLDVVKSDLFLSHFIMSSDVFLVVISASRRSTSVNFALKVISRLV